MWIEVQCIGVVVGEVLHPKRLKTIKWVGNLTEMPNQWNRPISWPENTPQQSGKTQLRVLISHDKVEVNVMPLDLKLTTPEEARQIFKVLEVTDRISLSLLYLSLLGSCISSILAPTGDASRKINYSYLSPTDNKKNRSKVVKFALGIII